MWDLIVTELTRATREILASAAHFLPHLLEMLIIVVAGWIIAYLLRYILRSVLRLIRFDKISEHAGAAQLLNKAALPAPSELLSQFAFWLAWLGFILIGIKVLDIVPMQEHISNFFGFLPRLFAGLFLLFVGLLGAGFFSRAALLAAVNANLPSPRLISATVRALIVVFTLSMCFEEIGVAARTVLVAFSLVFGALMLGLAIAFGLGGRELARRYLERRFLYDNDKKEEQDELSHL
ncbi:MAG: mechanosensitive ion channel family protein [Terriglobales bacterium]